MWRGDSMSVTVAFFFLRRKAALMYPHGKFYRVSDETHVSEERSYVFGEVYFCRVGEIVSQIFIEWTFSKDVRFVLEYRFEKRRSGLKYLYHSNEDRHGLELSFA
jgi:hypothetical protein